MLSGKKYLYSKQSNLSYQLSPFCKSCVHIFQGERGKKKSGRTFKDMIFTYGLNRFQQKYLSAFKHYITKQTIFMLLEHPRGKTKSQKIKHASSFLTPIPDKLFHKFRIMSKNGDSSLANFSKRQLNSWIRWERILWLVKFTSGFSYTSHTSVRKYAMRIDLPS